MENYTSTSYGSGGGVNDYSSIFPAGTPLISLSPPAINCNDKFPDRAPFDDLIDRRNWCLSHIRCTENEAEALREENINLQMTNAELNRRLNLMRHCQASLGHYITPPPPPPPPPQLSSVTDGFRRMMIGEKAAAARRRAWSEENDLVEKSENDRVKLPKSISVRSSGYLKTVQGCGSGSGSGTSEGQIRVPNRVRNATDKQRVYVHGVKKENQPLELDVFNQGMTKTELCNKWQQTGACPYGEHCQFAHGIGELRPVLRHPRYKTEVCRMILAGDHCPYGHRCHFRHSLTDDETLMGQKMKAMRSLQL